MIEFFRRVFVFLTHYLRTLSFMSKVANILLDLLNFLNFAISDLKKKMILCTLYPVYPSSRGPLIFQEK